MHQITAAQFKAAVQLDPAWASKLTEPIEITDFCEMKGSNITHLSPLLHFTGKNSDGNSAFFSYCKSLKIAEGKFEGFVSFALSSIEKIGDLSCGKDNTGWSADFSVCESLKIAEGNFEGQVYFSYSGIEKIGDLSCGTNSNGWSASFTGCKSLKVAEGKFKGAVGFKDSSIEKIGDLSCGKNNHNGIRLNLEGCPNLKSIPLTFNPKEIEADAELIEKLEMDRFIQKRREEIVEIEL